MKKGTKGCTASFVPFSIRCCIVNVAPMTKLIHPELSYKIHGVFLDIHRQLGPMLPEEFYQKAGLIGLKRIGVECEREKAFLVSYKGKRVGLYFVDLWIESGKILLELKSVQKIMPLHKAHYAL